MWGAADPSNQWTVPEKPAREIRQVFYRQRCWRLPSGVQRGMNAEHWLMVGLQQS
jgi:hypothetical protein